MPRVTEKTLVITNAEAGTATGWVNLNTNQENFHVGFSVRKDSPNNVAPVINIEGTMQDILASGVVASGHYFALISAVSTDSEGTNVAGEITFPVEAVRLRTISGGSGDTTLHFYVLQSGKV
jgi:hypothetical protein